MLQSMTSITRFAIVVVVITAIEYRPLCAADADVRIDRMVESSNESNDPMMERLREKLATHPQHSDTWRLIGRIKRRNGEVAAAIESVGEALRLDEDNAAAHFDMFELMQQNGQPDDAKTHIQRVFEIAPHSKYASQLAANGYVPHEIAETNRDTFQWDAAFAFQEVNDDPINVSPVGYEIQTFDGGDDLERRMQQLRSDADPEVKRFRIFSEMGLLYNSNISLTPISRELADSNAASFQGFLSPEIEWVAYQPSQWRIGPLARGYFTLNEHQWQSFNLASFQPGGFVERDLTFRTNDLIGRLDYVYSLDIFDGDRIGDRHAITASLITIRADLDVIYCYATTSFSQFDDDGVNPAISSLDGESISGGVSRFFQTESSLLPTWSIGTDIEWANTTGADFRYTAVTLHTEATTKLSRKLSFLPEFGIGGRNYPDFTGAPSRDELTWRVSGKLRWRYNDHLSIAAVAGHDRFASDNDEFDTERTQGGIVTTLTY